MNGARLLCWRFVSTDKLSMVGKVNDFDGFSGCDVEGLDLSEKR